MHTFFHGWRRKIGVVTLVMACVLTVGWVRSVSIRDEINVPIGQKMAEKLLSVKQSLCWVHFPMGSRLLLWKTVLLRRDEPEENHWQHGRVGMFRWTHQWCGFRLGTFELTGRKRPLATAVAIPYWSLVLPLTFLSAYLILWKPRKRA
jgi:hypothetical protein